MPMYNSTEKTTVIILKNIVKTIPESIYHYPKDKPIMDNGYWILQSLDRLRYQLRKMV